MDLEGIFFIVGLFSAVILFVALSFVFKSRESKLRHETIRFALERGEALPEGLMEQLNQRSERSPLHTLKGGLTLVALSLAFMTIYATVQPEEGWVVASTITGFVGVARLITWYVDPARKAEQNAA